MLGSISLSLTVQLQMDSPTTYQCIRYSDWGQWGHILIISQFPLIFSPDIISLAFRLLSFWFYLLTSTAGLSFIAFRDFSLFSPWFPNSHDFGALLLVIDNLSSCYNPQTHAGLLSIPSFSSKTEISSSGQFSYNANLAFLLTSSLSALSISR